MSQLVGDRDRDRAALELRRHYSEGRLTTDELAQRLETALRARNGAQLRRALKDLPAWWADSGAFRSPVRTLRNVALVVATAVLWLFLSLGLLVAWVAWLATHGASLGGLLAFPLLWFAGTWLLWRGNRRLRARP
jgi:Domain of unknown function (DUF1707)